MGGKQPHLPPAGCTAVVSDLVGSLVEDILCAPVRTLSVDVPEVVELGGNQSDLSASEYPDVCTARTLLFLSPALASIRRNSLFASGR